MHTQGSCLEYHAIQYLVWLCYFREYCDNRYQDEWCNEMCNTAECHYDGGDCDQPNETFVRISTCVSCSYIINVIHYWLSPCCLLCGIKCILIENMLLCKAFKLICNVIPNLVWFLPFVYTGKWPVGYHTESPCWRDFYSPTEDRVFDCSGGHPELYTDCG